MSGAWAREADAVVLANWEKLGRAALSLAYALTSGDPARKFWLNNASAIIRRERKALDVVAPRLPDWSAKYDDNYLIWVALRNVAYTQTVAPVNNGGFMAYQLREAEAALRTLHKRGRV